MAKKKYTPTDATTGYISAEDSVYDALATDLGLEEGAGTGDRIGSHSNQIGRVVVRLADGKRRTLKCASSQLEEVLGTPANGGDSILKGQQIGGVEIESAYLPRRVVYV